MVINWYGENCFKIQSGERTILTDPFEGSTGLTPPRLKPNLTIYTEAGYPPEYRPETAGTVIEGPGEYEVGGIEITGLALPTKDAGRVKTAYVVHLEEIRLGFLGGIESMPSPEVAERFALADILFVPAGGAPHLGIEEIAKLVKQLTPKIVVPALFSVKGLTRKAGSLSAFLGELGRQGTPEEKLSIRKKDVPAGTEVRVLAV